MNLKPMRLLTETEKLVINALLLSAEEKFQRFSSQLENIRVEEMNDGEMGSLKFLSSHEGNRSLEATIAEAQFKDSDGILVTVTLNIDDNNDLYELDVWKVDYSKLIEWPSKEDLIFD